VTDNDASNAFGLTAATVNEFMIAHFPGSSNFCDEIGPGFAITRIEPGASSLRPGGIISGPSVFAACDGALYFAVFSVIGLEPMALTSEMSIRFLRPALGTELFARAEINSVGGRTIVGTVTAWTTDQARPVAVAQGTYIRPPAGRWTTPS
jgi:acyl-coenzyme A thioesterase PaaI-like protein